MRILVTNDDGVQAKGLRLLVEALQEIAKVVVVAPDRDRSGASNSLTLNNPLRAREMDNGHISVEGTPTDCVHLALTGLLEEKPEFIISGINSGANLGDDVFYSGTVAAAVEGAILGLPSIAVSLVGKKTEKYEFDHYETAAQVAKSLISRLQGNPLVPHMVLNVNVPDVLLSEIKGYEITRLGRRHQAESVIRAVDPRGIGMYWIGPAGPEQDAGLGTDFYAILNKRVSITPLELDMTQYKAFDHLAGWLKGWELN